MEDKSSLDVAIVIGTIFIVGVTLVVGYILLFNM